jgi:very-short-patch-repair endonuclease
MLLPQVRIGIAERRRPDFVLFAPLQYLRYKRYAVELDGAHTPEQQEGDQARDVELAAEGYEVLSLRPNELGYFREVQKLVERIAGDMSEAERSARDIATEVEVERTVPKNALADEDIPF